MQNEYDPPVGGWLFHEYVTKLNGKTKFYTNEKIYILNFFCGGFRSLVFV